MTTKDAVAINTELEALFRLQEQPAVRLRDQEQRVRAAAAHLAGRAHGQLAAGVTAEQALSVPLRVRL